MRYRPDGAPRRPNGDATPTQRLAEVAEQRADDQIAEVAHSLRSADPNDASLPDRLEALHAAAVRAAGNGADLLATIAAGRLAAEDAAGSERLPLRERLRVGEAMAGRLLRALHTPSPPEPRQ